jgi:hypothetical protein
MLQTLLDFQSRAWSTPQMWSTLRGDQNVGHHQTHGEELALDPPLPQAHARPVAAPAHVRPVAALRSPRPSPDGTGARWRRRGGGGTEMMMEERGESTMTEEAAVGCNHTNTK